MTLGGAPFLALFAGLGGFFLISEDIGKEQAGSSHFCAVVIGHYMSPSLRRQSPPTKPLSLKDTDGIQGKEEQEIAI